MLTFNLPTHTHTYTRGGGDLIREGGEFTNQENTSGSTIIKTESKRLPEEG